MLFQYDGIMTKKKPTLVFFVVNSLSKFAVSAYASEAAAEENAVERNKRAVAMQLDVRYTVEKIEDGEKIVEGEKVG